MLENSAIAGTIYGISGTPYSVDQISFDPETYHFTYGLGNVDISNDIIAKDKYQLVPGFDKAQENFRRASENGDYKPGGIQPLNDSTLSILADQLITDPLDAPLESLSNEVSRVINNKGVKVIATVGIVGLLVWLALKD